jgi:hypothetical protein
VYGWFKLLDQKTGTYLNDPVPDGSESACVRTDAAASAHGHSHASGGDHGHSHDSCDAAGHSHENGKCEHGDDDDAAETSGVQREVSKFTKSVDIFASSTLAEFTPLSVLGVSTASKVCTFVYEPPHLT